MDLVEPEGEAEAQPLTASTPGALSGPVRNPRLRDSHGDVHDGLCGDERRLQGRPGGLALFQKVQFKVARKLWSPIR